MYRYSQCMTWAATSDANVCTSMLSHFSDVQLCATLWTVAHQAPRSMGFSRQEYRNRQPFPSPGDLLDPGIEPSSLMPSALAGGFFTTGATFFYVGEQMVVIRLYRYSRGVEWGGLQISSSHTYHKSRSTLNLFTGLICQLLLQALTPLIQTKSTSNPHNLQNTIHIGS